MIIEWYSSKSLKNTEYDSVITGESMIELGGNLTLVGFKELGYAELVVVKKVVGNYARKISDKQPFNNLTLSLKQVHGDTGKFELKAKLDANGTIYNAGVIEHNLFVGIDNLLKKIASQLKIND